jgi:hypothetical protein
MITAERLRELLHYDPETGVFTWRLPRRGVRAGYEAGASRSDGYRRIQVDGRVIYAHRLAWPYMTGEWPDAEIDHINGDPSDNRIVNLRPATRSQNSANGRKPSDNTSGLKGVSWHARGRKWRAQIVVNGKCRHLGLFDCPAAAHAAYLAATEKFFGEYARVA